MVNFNDERCSGCGACVSACPTKCLSLQISDSGEYRPKIDLERCVNCGKCSRVCHLDMNLPTSEIGQAYYGYALNDSERLQSSSGGLAFVFSKQMLKIGGVVCGACFTDDCHKVQHVVVDNENDLLKIRSSKYVESDLTLAYNSVKGYLTSGKDVLFIGLPCHVRALKAFLGKVPDNLVCIEIFCHGAPRAGLFHKYIDYLIRKKGKIKRFNFRSKHYGWNDPSYEIEFENGGVLHQRHKDNIYHLMFGYHNSLRSGCFKCVCRGENRCADISLGDYWGVEKKHPDCDFRKGVSAVFVNTPKGKKLFDSISDDVNLFPCKKEDILEKNPWFIKNYPVPFNQHIFENDIKKLSSTALFFGKYTLFYKFFYRIRKKFKAD